MYVLGVKLALSVHSDFIVALTAIDRFTFARLEWYFGFFAALGACCREHLASGFVAGAIISVTLCLPCFTAGGTALGLVSVALGLEELLFLSTKGECSSTIGTLERLVRKTHRMTSSLINSWLELRSSNTCVNLE